MSGCQNSLEMPSTNFPSVPLRAQHTSPVVEVILSTKFEYVNAFGPGLKSACKLQVHPSVNHHEHGNPCMPCHRL